MSTKFAIANIINHIVLVLDASASMSGVARELVKVADNQIEYLAQRSKELDQETRITVYTFGTHGWYDPRIDCLIYDKDVLRVPSISQLYQPNGRTPLIDATLTALDDLAMTPEKYGEHSFLVYVLTDGAENQSVNRPATLANRIASLPEHWTIATFVPNAVGVSEAKRFGFPAQNIAVWDTSARGVSEVGERIRQTTESFMQARDHAKKTGTKFRGTRNIFELKDPSLSQVASKLDALHPGQYRLFDVPAVSRIDEFVERKTRRAYRRGEAYYQLSKRETIQPQKQIAILGKNGVYIGQEARDLLGLPDTGDVRVSPTHNPDYEIFVQSTSNNRNLMPDTKLLVLS